MREPGSASPSQLPDRGARKPPALVSVLTPALNQGRWLSANLRSVTGQSYPTIEHVVMDGGSTDGSLDILRGASRPGLTWLSEPDIGQANALNKAFALSSGDIIGCLNSDDAYFGRDVIAEADRVFAAHPEAAVVYGHALLVDSTSRVLHVMWVPSFSSRLLRMHDFIVQPAAFVRRSALGDVLVDESYDFTMDYELWLRPAAEHRFRRLDRIVAVDRHHTARKSYMRAPVRSDLGRLEAQYVLPRGRGLSVAVKFWKIGARLAGLRLIRAALREPAAVDLQRDCGRVLIRQVAVPRSRMG